MCCTCQQNLYELFSNKNYYTVIIILKVFWTKQNFLKGYLFQLSLKCCAYESFWYIVESDATRSERNKYVHEEIC